MYSPRNMLSQILRALHEHMRFPNPDKDFDEELPLEKLFDLDTKKLSDIHHHLKVRQLKNEAKGTLLQEVTQDEELVMKVDIVNWVFDRVQYFEAKAKREENAQDLLQFAKDVKERTGGKGISAANIRRIIQSEGRFDPFEPDYPVDPDLRSSFYHRMMDTLDDSNDPDEED